MFKTQHTVKYVSYLPNVQHLRNKTSIRELINVVLLARMSGVYKTAESIDSKQPDTVSD